MPVNYPRLQATADRLITGNGRAIELRRLTPGGGPAHDPGEPASTVYAANGAVFEASQGTIDAFDNRVENGSLIDEKLRYLLLSPVMTKVSGEGPDSIEPKSGDVVNFDNADWSVLGCTPLNPAGTAMYFGLGVKRV